MYAIGSSARKGFGFAVIPVAQGVVSLVSGLFGSHSGKTTAVQRFVDAQNAGNRSLAHLLIDQVYSHAFLENIPDKSDWQQVWAAMEQGANADSAAYMATKMGQTGGAAGSPNQAVGPAGTPPIQTAGIANMLFSPVGIGAALLLFVVFGKKGRR